MSSRQEEGEVRNDARSVSRNSRRAERNCASRISRYLATWRNHLLNALPLRHLHEDDHQRRDQAGGLLGRLSRHYGKRDGRGGWRRSGRAALKYLSYISRHKWFVFVECWRLGIPVQGVTHDLSKFRPSEWFPYVEKFFGEGGPDTSRKFQHAWLLHQRRNPHHWQFWVMVTNSGALLALPMPDKYRKELLADWIGAGKAQGTGGPAAFYEKNHHRIIFHQETRKWLEDKIRPS